jgi:hypothetical protein
MDIAMIPTDEMLDDRAETLGDIAICKMAIAMHIVRYGDDESVYDRLACNERILALIDAELERRQVTP